MIKNLNFFKVSPKGMENYLNIEKYLSNSKIEKSLQELVKIRVSQINGCAYCLDMHTKDAVKNGETPQRIYLLNACDETKLFTKREKLALELAEKATLLNISHFDDNFYERLEEEFSDEEFADLLILIAQINSWNKFNVVVGNDIDKNL